MFLPSDLGVLIYKLTFLFLFGYGTSMEKYLVTKQLDTWLRNDHVHDYESSWLWIVLYSSPRLSLFINRIFGRHAARTAGYIVLKFLATFIRVTLIIIFMITVTWSFFCLCYVVILMNMSDVNSASDSSDGTDDSLWIILKKQ